MIRIPSWRPTDVSKRIPYGHHAEDRRGRKPLHAPERTIKLISQNNVLHRASIQKSSIFSSRSAISIDFFKYSGSQCQRFIAENLDGARCKALGRRRERSSRGAESEPGEHGEDQEGLLGDHGGEEREGGTERHEGVPQARCHGHAAALAPPPPLLRASTGTFRIPHPTAVCDRTTAFSATLRPDSPDGARTLQIATRPRRRTSTDPPFSSDRCNLLR